MMAAITSFFGALVLAAEGYFAYHAYQTNRRGWIALIIFVPVVGVGAYFFVVWLPEFERKIQRGPQGRQIQAVSSDISRLANPTANTNETD